MTLDTSLRRCGGRVGESDDDFGERAGAEERMRSGCSQIPRDCSLEGAGRRGLSPEEQDAVGRRGVEGEPRALVEDKLRHELEEGRRHLGEVTPHLTGEGGDTTDLCTLSWGRIPLPRGTASPSPPPLPHLEALDDDGEVLRVEPVKHDAVRPTAVGRRRYPAKVAEQTDDCVLCASVRGGREVREEGVINMLQSSVYGGMCVRISRGGWGLGIYICNSRVSDSLPRRLSP